MPASADAMSARKAAEVELRKLSLAVEQSPESIVITNLNAQIEYVLREALRKSGRLKQSSPHTTDEGEES